MLFGEPTKVKNKSPNALVVLMSTTLLGLAGCAGDAKNGRVIVEDLTEGTAEELRAAKKAACIKPTDEGGMGGEVSGDFCMVGTKVVPL
jgi:hypothetical protein